MLDLLSKELKVFIISVLPLVELRGAIPVAMGYGMSNLNAFIVSYLGSLLPVPFILIGFRPLFRAFKDSKYLNPLMERVKRRSMNNAGSKIQKYGTLGLFLFVSLPIPGTGVWSGSIAASMLNIRFKWAFPAIALGNFIAGIIILFFSDSVFSFIA